MHPLIRLSFLPACAPSCPPTVCLPPPMLPQVTPSSKFIEDLKADSLDVVGTVCFIVGMFFRLQHTFTGRGRAPRSAAETRKASFHGWPLHWVLLQETALRTAVKNVLVTRFSPLVASHTLHAQGPTRRHLAAAVHPCTARHNATCLPHQPL